MGNCEVRDHATGARIFPLIQRFQVSRFPIFLIYLYFMSPVFVSKLEFLWNGPANSTMGLGPWVGLLGLGFHYCNRAHEDSLHIWCRHVAAPPIPGPSTAVHGAFACKTQALLGGCVWGMITGSWPRLVLAASR